MALTRPTLAQMTTGIARISDPITTLHAGFNAANVDIGFLMNRANGLVSNVAIYWNETGNTFVTAFTANTGETNSNIVVTSYANLSVGTLNASSIVGTGIANIGGNLVAGSGTASTSTVTGALVVSGGVGISGNLNTGGYSNHFIATGSISNTSALNIMGNVYGQGGSSYFDFLSLKSTNSLTTNPNKYFRLNSTGGIEIINSAYSSNLFTLTDAGALTIPSVMTVGSITTTSGVFWANGAAYSTGGGGGGSFNGGTITSALTVSVATASTSTSTGAIITTGGIGVAGNVWCGQVYATNNGNGTNFAIGDDAWLGDINVANTTRLMGQQDGTQGYLVFGNTNATNYIGRSGSNPITVTGAFTVTGDNIKSSNTQATSTTTGALKLTGGMSIATGNLYIGGSGGIAMTHTGNIIPSANATMNLGSTTAWYGTFYGVSTQAKYADLAENYVSDAIYEPGTVVVFGGIKEITISTVNHDSSVAGVISTDPAYLMNAQTDGLPVAFTGRVPCKVLGPVNKGTVLVTSDIDGVAQAIDNSKFVPGCVIGKSLESINTKTIETIEVVVGRH